MHTKLLNLLKMTEIFPFLKRVTLGSDGLHSFIGSGSLRPLAVIKDFIF